MDAVYRPHPGRGDSDGDRRSEPRALVYAVLRPRLCHSVPLDVVLHREDDLPKETECAVHVDRRRLDGHHGSHVVFRYDDGRHRLPVAVHGWVHWILIDRT